MAISRSSAKSLEYQSPRPFTLPTVENKQQTTFTGALSFLNQFLPVTSLPREDLEYSASVLEEIMTRITDEFKLRNKNSPEWKKYQGQGSTPTFKAITFTNPNVKGTNLKDQPVEVFPLIIQDIQEKIIELVNDPLVPDTLGAYFARIFANNTTINGSAFWGNIDKLPSLITINSKDGSTKTVSPLSRAQQGKWPLQVSDIEDVVSVIGVHATDITKRNANISTTGEAGKIEVTDPNFPQSPYGTSPSGVPGTGGIKMTNDNLTVWNRINISDSSQGVGADKVDKDMGYTYLAHIGHTIEQVRYQPPSIETFPTDIPIRQYASNSFSNTTPNLPWVLSLPIETQVGPENWGSWLIKGNVGIENNQAFIRAFNNPSAAEGAAGQCPFSVFFPPPVANCACNTSDSAYFIWYAQDSGFTWNELSLFQTGRAQRRFFGRNTRMRITATITGSAGIGDTSIGVFLVGVRTSRVSNVNLQPFHNIIAVDIGDPSNQSAPVGGSTSLDINIMEQLNKILGSGVYDIGGLDSIEAIKIEVLTRGSATWLCDAEDGPGGRFLPEYCRSIKTCTAGDMTARVSSLEIFEPNLVGDPISAYK